MKNKKLTIAEIQATCTTCIVGSCCYEGAELTIGETKKIIKFNPKVAKPWFRLVEKHEEPEEKYPFSTIILGNTCVFQKRNNKCAVYKVRPGHCRDFPIDNGKPATYCERLCVLFYDQWPRNNIKRTYAIREKK